MCSTEHGLRFTGTCTFGYKTGDILKHFEELIRWFERVPGPLVNLVNQTVYCYDSESFRYTTSPIIAKCMPGG